LKVVPGTPEGRTPLWLDPDPVYAPKDQSQDLKGKEMELKYTATNLSRFAKVQLEKVKKNAAETKEERQKS